MTVKHVEILVEEPSMEAALRILVPKIVMELSFQVYPYQCKDDLLKKLPERLCGYAHWLPESWRIVVVLDRDHDDCRRLKARLDRIARTARVSVRRRNATAWKLVNRLAIEELEAWFFGDWDAVRAAYPRVGANVPQRRAYRDPDEIAGGTSEALERHLQRGGYFKGGLRKIEAARAIATHMDPGRNGSASFQALRDVLVEVGRP